MGAVEIGRKFAPDHHRRHQEAPKRVLATPAAFLRFLVETLRRRRRWGGLCSFQATRCRWVAAGARELDGGC
jgi:hypothetical protein